MRQLPTTSVGAETTKNQQRSAHASRSVHARKLAALLRGSRGGGVRADRVCDRGRGVVCARCRAVRGRAGDAAVGHCRAVGRRPAATAVRHAYVAAGMAALGAIGVAISTLTEHPVAAIAPVLVLARGRRQHPAVRGRAPPSSGALVDVVRRALRPPVATSGLLHRLLSCGAYAGDLPPGRVGALHLRGRHGPKGGPAPRLLPG